MKSILIAVCSYDGKVEASNCLSLVQNMRYLDRHGYFPELYFAPYMCYLPVARNSCVDYFMEGNFEDLIFVDADLTFGTTAMAKLLQHDVDIVGGAYPYKKDICGYPVELVKNDNGLPISKDELLEVEFIPTGLMRIRRNVIEKMRIDYADTIDHKGVYALFDTGFLFGDNVWYGEDIAFCKRWRAKGGKIWVHPDINFGHKGSKEWVGNYKKFLEVENANNCS